MAAEASSSREKITCSFCNKSFEKWKYDRHFVTHPTKIRERIWLGNAANSRDIKWMKKCGITHTLNCTEEIAIPEMIKKYIKGYKRIEIRDKETEKISKYIEESNKFIDDVLYNQSGSEKNKILIHCQQGISRSCSFLAAYLMWKEELSFGKVLVDIRGKRPIVAPNDGFYAELQEYEELLQPNDSNSVKKKKNKKKSKSDTDDVKTEEDNTVDASCLEASFFSFTDQ